MGTSLNTVPSGKINLSKFFEDNFCRENLIISAAGI